MELEFRCPTDRSDIRDYTFVDALQKIGRQQGASLQFAVWDYAGQAKYAVYNVKTKRWDEYCSYEEAEEAVSDEGDRDEASIKAKIFRQYPLQIYLPSDKNIAISSTSVFVPLNFSSAAFKVSISKEGELTLKDGNDDEVGSLKLQTKEKKEESPQAKSTQSEHHPSNKSQDFQVRWIPSKHEPGGESQDFEGELVVDQSGRLILQPPPEKQKEIFLRLGTGFTQFEMDVNNWSPVENQAPMHLCAANAGVGLLEYFERTSDGRHLNASRMFLHQAACHLMKVLPTDAPSVRAVVNALFAFGVPPEDSWEYAQDRLEQEPPAWCYSNARNYRAESYMRLDRPGMDQTALISQIKIFVYSGLPAIFGFHVHESVEQSQPPERTESSTHPSKHHQIQVIEAGLNPSKTSRSDASSSDDRWFQPGCIPFPTVGELYRGGHAAIVIGYDDNKIIVNSSKLRRQDREKLNPQGKNSKDGRENPSPIKAFLLNGNKLEFYEWDSGIQAYTKPTKKPNCDLDGLKHLEFMKDEYAKASGQFILLIKQPALLSQSTNGNRTNHVLTPRDVLDQERSPLFLETPRRTIIADDATLGDEYLVEEYLATRGAFKIRNSWGNQWGEQGYGWLPYTYVYQDCTFDWWSIIKFEWINTEEFGLLRDSNDVIFCSYLYGCL